MTNERTNGWTMNENTIEELNNTFESFFGPTLKKAEEALDMSNKKAQKQRSSAGVKLRGLNQQELGSIFDGFFGGDPVERAKWEG